MSLFASIAAIVSLVLTSDRKVPAAMVVKSYVMATCDACLLRFLKNMII